MGLSPDEKDTDSWTALHYACWFVYTCNAQFPRVQSMCLYMWKLGFKVFELLFLQKQLIFLRKCLS